MKPPRKSLLSQVAALTALFAAHVAAAQTPEAPPVPDAPPPANPAPETAPAGAETFDLSALVTSEGPAQGAATPVSVYGFADFSYYKPLYDKKAIWSTYGLAPRDTFYVGNLNFYVSKGLSDSCRALSEIRVLYEPHGENAGNGEHRDTTTLDHAAAGHPIQWGGIHIERAHVDCDLAPWVTLRLGQWFTPYGIWNIDHGSPTIIAVRRPFVVEEALMPEQQTGVQVLGSRGFGNFRVGYYLTLSNGRGGLASYRDLDGNKALGGRLELTYSGLGETTLSGSYYRGRSTATKYPRFDLGTTSTIIDITEQYDEQSFGADLKWDFSGLVVRAEYAFNEQAYTAVGRPATTQGLPFADGSRQGAYALLGYRLPWFGVMPYFLTQRYTFLPSPQLAGILTAVNVYQVGLNIQLSPAMILKTEYVHGTFPDAAAFIADLQSLEAQLSWVF